MQGVVGTELRKVRAEPIFFRCAFALISWAIPPGRQALTAAHEYCLCLKDRREEPIIENPDVFIDEYVSPYHRLQRASVGQRVGEAG